MYMYIGPKGLLNFLQVYLLQVMYMTIHYLTVLCMPTTEHDLTILSICIPDIYLGLYLTFLGILSGYDHISCSYPLG